MRNLDIVKDIYDGIVDAITSFWELITSLIEIFNNFINLIPVPFNLLIKFSIPFFLIAIVLKIKRAI